MEYTLVQHVLYVSHLSFGAINNSFHFVYVGVQSDQNNKPGRIISKLRRSWFLFSFAKFDYNYWLFLF